MHALRGREVQSKMSASVRAFRLGASLITVWLEVRVLPGPPRTLSNLGISRFAQNGPELAGFAVAALVSAETNSGVDVISAELSLPLKSGFPETETVLKRRRGSNVVVAPR